MSDPVREEIMSAIAGAEQRDSALAGVAAAAAAARSWRPIYCYYVNIVLLH